MKQAIVTRIVAAMAAADARLTRAISGTTKTVLLFEGNRAGDLPSGWLNRNGIRRLQKGNVIAFELR